MSVEPVHSMRVGPFFHKHFSVRHFDEASLVRALLKTRQAIMDCSNSTSAESSLDVRRGKYLRSRLYATRGEEENRSAIELQCSIAKDLFIFRGAACASLPYTQATRERGIGRGTMTASSSSRTASINISWPPDEWVFLKKVKRECRAAPERRRYSKPKLTYAPCICVCV